MKYASLKYNDIVDGEGICVSLWTQGCPFHCEGCHNPETWDENGGIEVPTDIKGKIIKAISANNIKRNFSILGGEPLAPWNLQFVEEIITAVRATYPHIKIFLWTGYTLEALKEKNDNHINSILDKIDVLIDGPFILSQRDITLPLRGSSNQRILNKGIDF